MTDILTVRALVVTVETNSRAPTLGPGRRENGLMGKAAADLIATGWNLLSEGDWRAARDVFTETLEEEEMPEALEGLSWAAWWMDDADAVFSARERAYLLYRQQREPAGAARMATWRAADELDFRGGTAVASGWLQRARRLLETVEPGPEHGWLAFHEGFVVLHSGESRRAAELGREAAEAGRRYGVPDLEMLGLALEGSILVSEAQIDEGMRYLDEATATAMAGEATIPISGAWACCFLVGSCIAVFDYERAFEWCDRIAEFADRYGSRYMLAFCRAEYGEVYLWRGRWDDAERVLEASIEDFSRSRPAMVTAPLVRLAELRRRQARVEEANSLLDRAGTSMSAQVCRARLALDGSQPRRAVDLAERLLRQMAPEAKLERVPVLQVLIRAHVASGEPAEARRALTTLREIEAMVGTDPLRAATDLGEGLIEAAGGDHERARVLLEDAVDRFERIEAPFEAAQARIELASSLAALGNTELAEREVGIASTVLLDLGAVAESDRAQKLLRPGVRGVPDSEVTSRERDVLELLAEGLTNRQIAERLEVSEHTVHRHVTNILRKLDLPSRAAAAAYAVRAGLLD